MSCARADELDATLKALCKEGSSEEGNRLRAAAAAPTPSEIEEQKRHFTAKYSVEQLDKV